MIATSNNSTRYYKKKVDAIVNTSNKEMVGYSGVDPFFPHFICFIFCKKRGRSN